MKNKKRVLGILLLAVVLAFSFTMLVACKPEEEPTPVITVGTINGVVSDAKGEVIEGALVLKDAEEDGVMSDEAGKFVIKNVEIGNIKLTISYAGYAQKVKELTSANFTEGAAQVTIVMEEGQGKIVGKVNMDGNTSVVIKSVSIKVGSLVAVTDEKGNYAIDNVPMLGTKRVEASCVGYANSSKSVVARSYKNGIATLNFSLVQNDYAAMAGMKPYQIATMDAVDASIKTFSATGGNRISSYWVAAPNALSGTSKVESHAEGFCLNANTRDIRDNMVSYIFTKLNVTETNKFLTAYARVFFGQNGGASREDEIAGNFNGSVLAKLGLYVLNDKGEFDKTTYASTTINTESFMPVTYDLTKYVGQTVTVILGTKEGFHCCLDRIELGAVRPAYLTVTGAEGLGQIQVCDTIESNAFDATQLKEQWLVGGGVGKVAEGIQLNGADPWKAVDFDTVKPQPINSYMYIKKAITAQNSKMTVKSIIVKKADLIDSSQPNHKEPFYPYVTLVVIGADGSVLNKLSYTKIDWEVETPIVYDLSAYEGQTVTVMIAANVGYRATISNVTFATKI